MAASLKGKTALITGAARRIGRETAITLAQEGANIAVHYNTSADEAEDLRRELAGHDVSAWTVQANFDKPEEYKTLIERTLAQTQGALDIVVNNASIFPKDSIDELTFDGLLANVRVNAWAPFVICRAFARQVGKGHVINLLDSRIRGYDWTHVGYILSKHMLAEMTKMLALEYAPDIQVNGVAPGLILPPPGKPESYIDAMVDTVPLKQHGDPQYIADAIVYLAKSEYCTGEVIFVDGGRHLREYIAERKGER